MSVTSALGNQAKLLWQFLGFFQKPYLRFLHAIIAVLVILQILSSFAMHMLSSGQLNPALSSWLASWYHILSGLLVVILSLLLAADSLTKRGFHYFFPYLWGDTEQLKKDIQASLRFKVVPPRPKGLATRRAGARARRAAARRTERPDLVHPLAERLIVRRVGAGNP